MDEFFRLTSPIEVLKEGKNELIKYYMLDYTKDKYNIIKQRMDRTIYIFESTPDIVLKFLLQNENNITDWSYMEKIEIQAKDYCILKNNIKKEEMLIIYDLFCQYHNINTEIYKNKQEEILKIANSATINRKKYENECLESGIKPIKEEKSFNDFIKLKTQISTDKNKELLFNSLWGQELIEQFIYMGFTNERELFYILNTLSEKNNINCSLLRNDFGIEQVVIFPLICQYYNGGNIDRLFLHENRHVVETGNNCMIGLQKTNGDFKIINEIRTEMHAIIDNEKLPTIFSKKIDEEQKIKVYYEELFPLSDNLFEEYKDIFDLYAFENDLDKLFKIFGKKNMYEYDEMLTEIYIKIKMAYCQKSGNLEINANKYLEKVKTLKENARNSDYFITKK